MIDAVATPPPHRLWPIALWLLACLLGVPVLLIMLLLLLANTGPGRALITREVGSLSGGMVEMQGLAGRFPDALRVRRLAIADAHGTWLSLDDVALDWSPLALLGGHGEIERLSATRVAVARLPVASASSGSSESSGGFTLPVPVALDDVRIGQLDLAAPVAGRAARLRVQGSGRFRSLRDARATLAISRRDSSGTYQLDATATGQRIDARLRADEPAGGLVGGLANLPALGALALSADIHGKRTALRAVATLSAGALRASAHGTIDLPAARGDIDLDVTAPAMAPRPDLSWAGARLSARVSGAFTRPDVTAHATLTGLVGGGATVQTLKLDARGNDGMVHAQAVLTGLVLPQPAGGAFGTAPVSLTLEAALGRKLQPLTFTLRSDLLSLDGTAQGLFAASGDQLAAHIVANVPALAPLAAIGKLDLRGSTRAVATVRAAGPDMIFTVDGTADFTGGQAPVPALLGQTRYGVTARLRGQDIVVSRAQVDGAALHATVTGADRSNTDKAGGGLDLAWTLGLPDLARAAPGLVGTLTADGHVQGPPTGLAMQATITGDVGAHGIPRGPVKLVVTADGLPSHPSGQVRATGLLDGAALSLALDVRREPDGGLRAVISQADWKSLRATGTLNLPSGARFPIGTLTARMTRLADLAPLIGQPIAGDLHLRLETAHTGGRDVSRIAATADHLEAGGADIARLSLTGQVRDPLQRPDLALMLAVDGLAAQRVTGHAQVSVDGALAALRLGAQADLTLNGAPATIAAGARVDMPSHQLQLTRLAADYRGESLRLNSPARIDFGARTAIDRLAVSMGQARLELAGEITPRLALSAHLRGVTPALLTPFMPGLHAAGSLTADATLAGSLTAPTGKVRLAAAGVRDLAGPAASLPAARARMVLTSNGQTVRLDATAGAGAHLHAALHGNASLTAAGPIALSATADADLSLLDPVLGAAGQRAAGRLGLDMRVSGSRVAPAIDGTISLADGELQDFARGVRLRAIQARLVAQGDSLRVVQLSATAGTGTLGASGTVGVLQPGLPVDLHLTARNATPLTSDLLTARLDADLTVSGQAMGALRAAGRIRVLRADINIPDALPPSVAVLNVRRPGALPPPPPAPTQRIVDLAITVDAPEAIFVRGHGLDAELGGTLTIGGTSALPRIGGGFDLRNGTFSVAGTTLTFSKGVVAFDGTGVTHKIDPTLDFVADSTSGGVTATLTVGGYADAPKITLSSSPSLPQDEVLAHLLFGESVKDLSAVQLAEIGAALAEFSGVTGGGGDPLAAVRNGLGLDRLSVGGGSGSGATVQAGKYVARGVYVGARQGTDGGTAAILQLDLTKRLKAQAQLATGGGSVQGATPDNDPGSTIGLSYQFDY